MPTPEKGTEEQLDNSEGDDSGFVAQGLALRGGSNPRLLLVL